MSRSVPVVLIVLGLLAIVFVTDAQEPLEKDDVRGYIGASLDYEEVDELGRYRVSRITPGGPAESSALKVGDLIVAVNGVPFRFTTDLERYEAFLWLRPGDVVAFEVLRESGEQETVEIVAGSMDPETQYQWSEYLRSERQSEAIRTLHLLGSGGGGSFRVDRGAAGQLRFSASGYPDTALHHVEGYLRSLLFFKDALDTLKSGDGLVVLVSNQSTRLNLEITEAPDYILDPLEKSMSRYRESRSTAGNGGG